MKHLASLIVICLPPAIFLLGSNEQVMLEKALSDAFGRSLIYIYLLITAVICFELILRSIRLWRARIRNRPNPF